jgi:hypothetical protein
VQYIERTLDNNNLITLVLLGCILLITVAKWKYPLRFQEFMRLPFTNKYFFIYGKNDPIYHPFSLLLFAVQLSIGTLFIFLFLRWNAPEVIQTKPYLYWQLLILASVLASIKIVIERILGYLFKLEEVIDSYVYQKLTYRNLIAFLFIVSVILITYIIPMSIEFLISFCAIIILLNGIALYSSFKARSNLIIRNFFYFILYLCALEISPYIILYKVFI